MKRFMFITFGLVLFSSYSFAQSVVSGKYKAFSIVKEVKPPLLSVDRNSVKFVDADGNNAINANEKCCIQFKVDNTGYGDGLNCKAQVSLSGSKRGITVKDLFLPAIGVGKTIDVSIPVQAGMDTEEGNISLIVSITEPNGFGADPFTVDIPTKAFEEPFLKVADYAVVGSSGTLQKKSKFDLQILLQNTKYGKAEDVNVVVSVPEGIFVLDGEQNRRYPMIEGGQTASLDFSLIANNNYSSPTIPITVTVKEKYGRFAESKVITLQLNQTLASDKIHIEEVASDPRSAIAIASLSSIVDKNIPQCARTNDKTFVLIIGNENYQNDSKVDYARNDGMVFKQYCESCLGIPATNIRLCLDASLNNIRREIDWIQEVSEAYKGDASVIFYYAGHGVPDEETRDSFILPVDGDGRNPSVTGMSLDNLYAELSKCKTRSTVVFMDACFSGAKRDGQMLASARGVMITPRVNTPQGNLVVISACTGQQTAYKYDEQKHGMFTFYLLKKLQETSGDIELGQLSDYIIENVRKTSIVSNNKSQIPNVSVSPAMSSGWEHIKL